MSSKSPSLFTIVYEAFGGWSPGGLAVRDRSASTAEDAERWVLLLERDRVSRVPGWERVVVSLNQGPLPGVAEVRVVERIEQFAEEEATR